MKISYDNKYVRALTKLVDCIILSTLWVALCIPIVTIGAATTAMYYTVHKSIRRDKGYLAGEFWGAFKSNLGRSTGIWLIQLIVLIVLSGDIAIMFKQLQEGKTMGYGLFFFAVLFLVAVMWVIITCCYNARFEMNWKGVLKNSGIIAIAHLPWTFLMLLIFIGSVVLYTFIPILIFVAPALIFFVYDFILESIFRKYMSEEDLKREIEDEMIAMR